VSTADISFIGELETIVLARLNNPTEHSYTAKLAAAGIKRIAQKVGEEGVEVALAAVAENREEIIDETADLLYHLLVLLGAQGISLGDIADRLESRHSARHSAT
jgi:phosphoribosyl-ATP pyrophosphohydrolase/phosphoribosyl-AMP cyclohydrolase